MSKKLPSTIHTSVRFEKVYFEKRMTRLLSDCFCYDLILVMFYFLLLWLYIQYLSNFARYIVFFFIFNFNFWLMILFFNFFCNTVLKDFSFLFTKNLTKVILFFILLNWKLRFHCNSSLWASWDCLGNLAPVRKINEKPPFSVVGDLLFDTCLPVRKLPPRFAVLMKEHRKIYSP